MEPSGQRAKPAWMPTAATADALRENLRSLKDIKLGDSPAEAAASLRENLRGLKDLRPGNSGGPWPRDMAGATAPPPPFEERPELYVGAAFAGGLALAGFVRLLGR